MARQAKKPGEDRNPQRKTRKPNPEGQNDIQTPDRAQQAPEADPIPASDSEHGGDLLNDPRLSSSTSSELLESYLQQLQQTQGNTQVQRLVRGHTPDVQRQSESFPVFSWLDRQRHNVMEATGLESEEEAERGRATAFYAHGTYGPETVIGAQGRGGFDVTYDPVSGVEQIRIKGGVRFEDGLTDDGTTVTPHNAGLQGAANTANGLSGPDRAAFVSQYQWTPDEQTPWVEKLTNRVQSMWSSGSTGLSFFINKPQWDWITAHIQVVVDMRAMEAGDSRADDDHLVVTAVKEPFGGSAGQGTGAEVSHGTAGSGFDQTMLLSSQDVNPRGDNMLTLSNTVTFDHDSVELSATAKSTLDTWIATYQGAPGNAASNPTQVTIMGYTSASGSEEYNLNLGMQRAEKVREYISSHGFTNVDARATEISFGETEADPAAAAAAQERERRVELIVDSGDAQVVAAHEFGHAFGLGDEYATGAGSAITGTGATAGTAAGHDTLAQGMSDESGNPLPGAIHENNEGIMSLGNAVRPQHYATFDKALKQVTGINDWSVRS